MVVDVLGVGRWVVHDKHQRVLTAAEHKVGARRPPLSRIADVPPSTDGCMFVRFEQRGGGARGKQAHSQGFDEWRCASCSGLVLLVIGNWATDG